jgi:GNAT superfamily N-acetyltransferase
VAVTIKIRPAGDADLPAWIELKNAVTPDWSTSPEQIAWADRTYPGGRRLLAELDGRPVGVASAGRIYMHPPDYPQWWAEIAVDPAHRRWGAGTALLAAISRLARATGKTGLQVPASDARPEGPAFLRHHGFEEFERSKAVRRDLDPGDVPEVRPPDGIELVTLAARPDLVPDVHQVALETVADIPGGEPMTVGELDEFRARDVDRHGMRHDGFFVALDGADVVGYACVLVEAGRPTIGLHDMTAVVARWRGRGLAGALKRATIAWATRVGLEALETGNDEANAAMRAVNARLGYRPLPDMVFFRGPLLAEPGPAEPGATGRP